MAAGCGSLQYIVGCTIGSNLTTYRGAAVAVITLLPEVQIFFNFGKLHLC
jgi:hypothetical protein